MGKKSALVFATKDFEDMELFSVVDILKRGDIDVKIVSLDDSTNVMSKSGVIIQTDLLFNENLSADVMILPGGGVIERYLAHTKLHHTIMSHYNSGGLIGAICAAPSLLGFLGICRGRRVTGYPNLSLRKYLKDGIVVESDVVVDENIITSKSPATALPFALKLLEVVNRDEFLKVKNDIVYL